jgi:hypothetical protein
LSRFDWTHMPEMPTVRQSDVLRMTAAERAEQTRKQYSLPFAQGLTVGSPGSDMFTLSGLDSLDNDEITRGLMDVDIAYEESYARDYLRGMWKENTAAQRYAGRRIQTLYGNQGMYNDTILQLDQYAGEIIDSSSSLNRWNAVAVASLQSNPIPFWDTFSNDVYDIMGQSAPEGWDVDAALEVFQTKDPQKFNAFIIKFGNKEAIREMVKGAKNPAEFFYKLSDGFRQHSIGKAIDKWESDSNWITYSGNWVYQLGKNGIINDPDLIPELLIGLGLTVVTGGAFAAVAGGSYMLAKMGKTGLKMNKVAKTFAAINKFNRHTILAHLPSNIGPTMVQKYIFKDAYRNSAKGFLKGRFWFNRLGDVGEGTVTGFLAEFANQTKKINSGILDDYDGKMLLIETLMEAGISPLINPTIGGFMNLVGQYGIQPLIGTLDTISKDFKSMNALGSTLETLSKWSDPDAVWLKPFRLITSFRIRFLRN